MKQARKAATHKKRRIIMNNDGNDARGIREGEQKTSEAFLARADVAPRGFAQVDAPSSIAPASSTYTRIRATRPNCEGMVTRSNWIGAWELTKQGTDSLTLYPQSGDMSTNMEVF
jgi:hypothetical protein